MGFLDKIFDLFRGNKSFQPEPLPIPQEDRAAAILVRLSYDVSSGIGPAIVAFQRHRGIAQTGRLDERTLGLIADIESKLAAAPDGELRRWRITRYYVALESDYPGERSVPVHDRSGEPISTVSAAFFANMSLEGDGKLDDGRLLNVAGGRYVSVEPIGYEPVFRYYRTYVSRMLERGRQPKPSRYFGIELSSDRSRVAFAQPFQLVGPDRIGVGYGIERAGIAKVPYRTVAADIGAYGTSDSRHRGTGGLVPIGTRAFVLELVGSKLPDGTVHDGWVTVNDTGGGIFGAHFDLFTGVRRSDAFMTERAHIWFEGCEQRIERDYELGLFD